jgi:hypothetical protein
VATGRAGQVDSPKTGSLLAAHMTAAEIYDSVTNGGANVRGTVWAWQDKQGRSTKRKKDELDLMRIGEAHSQLRRLIPAEIVKQL